MSLLLVSHGYIGGYSDIFSLDEMRQRFFEGPTIKYGGDHLFSTVLVPGGFFDGRSSVVDEASALAPLCGSLGWDNRRIKQRPNPLNSATIAPEHCIYL